MKSKPTQIHNPQEYNPGDIQGLIIQGYRHHTVRYLLLGVRDTQNAKALLSDVTKKSRPLGLSVTTGERWREKPSVTLNVGFTYSGLEALGLPDDALKAFALKNKSFAKGAINRVDHIGDVDESCPDKWYEGKEIWEKTHVIAILYSEDKLHSNFQEGKTPWLDRARKSLLQELDAGYEVLFEIQGNTMSHGGVHFGYRDGLSNPSIDGFPKLKFDSLPSIPAGAILLGYPSQFPQYHYPVPEPTEFSANGSFNVVRVLEQDTAAFDEFLHQNAENEAEVEKLAAQICGRWRDGAPLALYPDKPEQFKNIPPEKINGFDYVPSEYYPHAADDSDGANCPYGSHMRRANPRSGELSGGKGAGHLRRIVRRGMPYGPPFDPKNPNDGIKRGLIGSFICVNIEDQFEFLTSQWMQMGSFTGKLDFEEKDVFLGTNNRLKSKFTTSNGRAIQGFGQFIKTRGSLYTFMPSITGLRYLSNLP